MSSINSFFDRRFPLSGPWLSLGWKTTFIKANGKPSFDSSAYQTTAELIEGAAGVSRAPHARDGYFCTAALREADFRQRSRPPQALRRLVNVAYNKGLHVEIDVGKGAYVTSDEALREYDRVRSAIGLPQPSFVVYSAAPADGSPPTHSGVHVHHILNEPLGPEEWALLARPYNEALLDKGLKFDPGIVVDMVRLLRFPGSRNFNGDQLRLSRLEPHVGPDCNVDATRSLLAPYARPAPPPRPPGSFISDASFDEVVEVVGYLTKVGRFDRSRYANMRDMVFALSCIVIERPELHDAAIDLIRQVVDATGRDYTFNESLFSEASSRTPDWTAAGGRAVTAASLFKAARDAGWLPSHPEDDLTDEQRVTLGRAKRKLWDIFRDGHHREAAADDAARLAGRINDEHVLTALAPSLAVHLARDGWGEPTILDAIELFKGHRDAALARWAKKKEQPHG